MQPQPRRMAQLSVEHSCEPDTLGGDTVDDKDPASPNVYYTSSIPRLLVHQVMQDISSTVITGAGSCGLSVSRIPYLLLLVQAVVPVRSTSLGLKVKMQQWHGKPQAIHVAVQSSLVHIHIHGPETSYPYHYYLGSMDMPFNCLERWGAPGLTGGISSVPDTDESKYTKGRSSPKTRTTHTAASRNWGSFWLVSL